MALIFPVVLPVGVPSRTLCVDWSPGPLLTGDKDRSYTYAFIGV
jgi:hypothetical protein